MDVSPSDVARVESTFVRGVLLTRARAPTTMLLFFANQSLRVKGGFIDDGRHGVSEKKGPMARVGKKIPVDMHVRCSHLGRG